MRTRRLTLLCAVLCMVSGLCGTSWAMLVVDTGLPSLVSIPSGLFSDNWYAGKFSLTSTTDITAMRGYMGTDTGLLDIRIYADSGGGIPSGSPLFTHSFTATPPFPPVAGWQGVSGLMDRLAGGTYWISFEVPAGSGYDGVMYVDPPSPLTNYAVYVAGADMWFAQEPGYGRIAVQIEGTPVPLPAALWLLGPGLFGLAAARRAIKG